MPAVFEKLKGRRFEAAVAGALALHAMVIGSSHFLKARSVEGERPGAIVPAEIEIESGDTFANGRAPEAPPTAPEPSETSPEKRAPSEPQERPEAVARRPSSETPPGPPGPPSPAEPTTGEPSIPSGGQGYSADPSAAANPSANGTAPLEPGRKPVDLGIGSGDWSRYVDPTAQVEQPQRPRAERAPAPVSSTGGLVEALEADDQRLGLGAAGPVLTAAHEAGHSPEAPAIGSATFSIRVLRTGVVEVDLTGASSNAPGWRKVAESMAAAIKRKPPRIHNGRNGVLLKVEVVAQEKWPNGQVARTEGPSIAVTPPKFQATDESVEELGRRNPAAVPPSGSPSEQPALKANVEPPGVFLQGRGKVCSYKIGITPLGPMATGGCDPSNIGARASRIVSARVTQEKAL